MTTSLSNVTPEMVDQAIALQCQAKVDRDAVARACGASPEFMEYVFMISRRISAKYNEEEAVASALTLGIEIGIALVGVLA